MIVEGEQGFGFQEGINIDVTQRAQMAEVRDNIANQIWENYRRGR